MFPFLTVGHSTRAIDEFVALLRAASVSLVADIRTVPKLRTNPQYNKAAAGAHATFEMGYEPIAELGGLSGKAKLVAPCLNSASLSEAIGDSHAT
jgi:uncharacterized protein (DUF488 family)